MICVSEPLDSLTFLSWNAGVAGGLQMVCNLVGQMLVCGTMTHAGGGWALIGEPDAAFIQVYLHLAAADLVRRWSYGAGGSE